MKNVVVIVLLLLVAVIAHGQAKHAHKPAKQKYYPFLKLYHDVGQFHDGLASAMYDGKYGFIDTGGREVIKCIYDTVGCFQNGTALVNIAGKKGVVDRTGNYIIPCLYAHLDGGAYEPYTTLDDDPFHIQQFRATYDEIRPITKSLFVVGKGSEYGVINNLGKVVIPIKFREIRNLSEHDLYEPGPYSEDFKKDAGLFKVRLGDEGIEKWGLIDSNGKELTPCIYTYIFQASDTVISVEIGHRWGCINKSGKIVIPVKYCNPLEFIGNFAIVYLGDEAGLLSRTGVLKIPFMYRRIYNNSSLMKNGYARVEDSDGHNGLVDTNGRVIIPITSRSFGDFQCHRAAFWGDGKFGIIDDAGAVVCIHTYDEVGDFRNGFAQVKLNGKWGLVNSQGQLKIPCEYLRMKDPAMNNNGIVIVANDKLRYGAIDTNNKIILRFIYNGLSIISANRIEAWNFNGAGYLDAKGHVIIPLKYNFSDPVDGGSRSNCIEHLYNRWLYVDANGKEYDDPQFIKPRIHGRRYCNGKQFRNSLAPVLDSENKWGVIDESGREIIPCKFAQLDYFYDGLAIASDDSEMMFINKSGQRAFTNKFDKIMDEDHFREGYVRVVKDYKLGLIDTSGKIVLNCEYDYLGELYDGILLSLKGHNWNYIDVHGNVVIANASNENFRDGVGIIHKNDSVFCVDRNGSPLFRHQLAKYYTLRFSDGMGAIMEGEGYGKRECMIFINKSGERAFVDSFSSVKDFHNGCAAVAKIKNGIEQWGIIDRSGAWTIPADYDEVSNFSDEGIALVKINGRFGFINKLNRLVIPNIYDDCSGIPEGKDPLIWVRKNNEWGYINKTGKRVLWFK